MLIFLKKLKVQIIKMMTEKDFVIYNLDGAFLVITHLMFNF